ncbi:MAG TPA: sodium/proton-translocating pyrophosphatase, partial [Syntrophales bacterium]|nr:sodium/proton-translocating pyrophosphatase [Syntrophales bacterium]
MVKNRLLSFIAAFGLTFSGSAAFAGEADIKLPDLSNVIFNIAGGTVAGLSILYWGLVICATGMIFGLIQYKQTKDLPAHKSMLDVSAIIWETCKTYLTQQGKFLAFLWVLIAICIVYYFAGLQSAPFNAVLIILFCSVMGILGSYGVAWFGIRINTVANSRAAFASLGGDPMNIINICLRSGMSVGLLLVSVELFFMICILAFVPKELAGPSFVGFAIGESLGASALRICGGIFTKIADIGSDLMKIVFHLPEDDPKNPGVIADCTGDNAGDSVGPTA